MRHAKNEYQPKAMTRSGAIHRPVEPAVPPGQPDDSAGHRSDPAYGSTQDPSSGANVGHEEFVDE